MKIIIHDYAGHPFQAQLSRSLAGRGHEVHHLYCASNSTSPKGALQPQPGDPPALSFQGVPMRKEIVKTSFFERWRLEKEYGSTLAQAAANLHPDIVISANTPLDALNALSRTCKAQGIPWIFWLQDRIGLASSIILRKKLPIIGFFAGKYYTSLEDSLMRQAAFVIGISDEFKAEAQRAGVSPENYSTIPNWAPLDEILPKPKRNPWSEAFNLADRFVFLYSGTLGFKHNPHLFLALAKGLKDHPQAIVVINSEGPAADWLKAKSAEDSLTNVMVNGFQAYASMSDVLGSADVLLSILELDAGSFSIPSKVLSYHCAARPCLLAVTDANLASRIVQNESTGIVTDPQNVTAFVQGAISLMSNDKARADMAARARSYAERTFDIELITDKFEMIAMASLTRARNS